MDYSGTSENGGPGDIKIGHGFGWRFSDVTLNKSRQDKDATGQNDDADGRGQTNAGWPGTATGKTDTADGMASDPSGLPRHDQSSCSKDLLQWRLKCARASVALQIVTMVEPWYRVGKYEAGDVDESGVAARASVLKFKAWQVFVFADECSFHFGYLSWCCDSDCCYVCDERFFGKVARQHYGDERSYHCALSQK